MQIRTKMSRESTEVPLTSFMDMMFLLLIFFMVTTSFQEETRVIDMALPRAENPKVITMDEGIMTLTLTKDERIFLDDEEIEPPKLKEALNKKILAKGSSNVLIKGDIDVKYRNMVAVIDILTALQVEGISFVVLYGGGAM